MRKIKMSIVLLIVLYTFQRCHKGDASSFAKAAVSTSCSSTINFSVTGDDVFADVVSGGTVTNIGGEGADELGINFYSGTISVKSYSLDGVAALLYWDPGNDGLDEYGSISGTVTVNSINYINGIIQSVDITFNNVTIKNGAGDTKCVNAGHIMFNFS